MIGALLFVVGVVAAIVAVAAMRNPHGRQVNNSVSGSVSTVTVQPGSTRFSTPSSSSKPSSSSSPSKSRPSKPQTAIYILNNTTRPDLGTTIAAKFRAKGWHVVGTENYSNDIISSCAYYDPGDPQNLTVARELRSEFPGIQRVAPRFPQLPTYPIVVILNPDYPG
jgi:LytR cell envelope-related transcriptional attenuator